MQPWTRITTGDDVIEQLQDNAEPLMRVVESSELIHGRAIKGVAIDGTKTVSHGLERVLEGYFVMRKDAPADVYDAQGDNKTPGKTLDLVSTAVVTVDLWVF